jgi:hypothetical protein
MNKNKNSRDSSEKKASVILVHQREMVSIPGERPPPLPPPPQLPLQDLKINQKAFFIKKRKFVFCTVSVLI